MAKGDYKSLSYTMVGSRKVNPGETITAAELKEAGQNEDNIQQLIDGGAISADMDAPLHPDHADLEDDPMTSHDGGAGVDKNG